MRRLSPLSQPTDLPAGLRVWHLRLDLDRDYDDDFTVLAEDERVRAAQYHQATDRRRYVQTRACLRRLLAHSIGCRPATVPLQAGPQGKPALSGGRHPVFNLSHAGEHAYLALAEMQATDTVGIDIEQCLPSGPLPEWLTLVCDPEEAQAIRRADDPPAQLLLHWVAKEAVLKAMGTGLSHEPSNVRVIPGEGDALILHTGPTQARHLRLMRLPAPPGYTAALAWNDK